jgi:hypothetical protein
MEMIKQADWSQTLLILGLVAIAVPFVIGIASLLR